MNKITFSLFVIISIASCNVSHEEKQTVDSTYIEQNKVQIASMLDSFHMAAAKADFDAYFGYYDADAVFLGTDATEHWNLNSFKDFSKPYFDRGRAWNFTSIEKHIYFGEMQNIAWFDELLSTQMKICRGSGVVVKQNNEWKVKQYVLSMTIPNSLTDTIVGLKSVEEDILLEKMKK